MTLLLNRPKAATENTGAAMNPLTMNKSFQSLTIYSPMKQKIHRKGVKIRNGI
jgi:hypothetical protein